MNESFEDIDIVTFASMETFADVVDNDGLKADIVIVHVSGTVYEADLSPLNRILANRPGSRIIVLYDQRAMILPFLKIGAHGFLKKTDLGELKDCIHWIQKGRRYCNNEITNWIINASPKRLGGHRAR
ncbi:hypothetical protein [Dyadobacter sp. 676]|uniref:Response regulator transcription factor n=1 Tax=Dyadobacter sp. 676 TaxID=3088362 RepID=A0AAU8FIU8_9BACT